MKMLIIWKFPKSIAGRTNRPRGPRVWDPWRKMKAFHLEVDLQAVLFDPTHFITFLNFWET